MRWNVVCSRYGSLKLMIQGASTHVFYPQRLDTALLQALVNGGAETIEIFAARWHFDYADRRQMRELAAWFRDAGVPASLHQPLSFERTFSRHEWGNLNLLDREKMRRIEAMDEVKRALEAAEVLPFLSCAIHLGNRTERWDEVNLEYALTALEHLRAFARPLGVQLLVENMEGEFATPEHLLEVLRTGHFDDIGVCLDVGHAHLGDGVAEALEVLGERVQELHLHDNQGVKDEHLWPGNGTLGWEALWPAFEGLKSGVRGVLEIGYALRGDAAEQARAVWDERRRVLDRAAEVRD